MSAARGRKPPHNPPQTKQHMGLGVARLPSFASCTGSAISGMARTAARSTRT
nr:MAG TPA: hypothetical protein [Caudoviricetes sp.]